MSIGQRASVSRGSSSPCWWRVTTLLLDPETRQTFLPPAQSSRDGRMPTFCGRVAVDGTFAPHRPLCDFFDALKRFCQTRRVSVAELFRLYDDSAASAGALRQARARVPVARGVRGGARVHARHARPGRARRGVARERRGVRP